MKKVNEEQYQEFSSVMHLIYKRLNSLNQDMNSIFPDGITSSELNVLGFVRTNPDAFLKEISQKLSLPSSTLTSVIDRLERRELIHRVISQKNRRSYSLELTEKGIKIDDIHEKNEKKIWENFLDALGSDAKREELIELLKTIAHIL